MITDRAEAWKHLALAVRREYGKAMGLLGEASGTLHRLLETVNLPDHHRSHVSELDARIVAYAKRAQVPVPRILERELRELEEST